MDVPEGGTYMGRLVGLIDLDLQPGFEYQGEEIEPQYKVTFTYELPGSRTKDDRPHWVSEDFKVSDHERSKMYARVRALDPTGSLSDRGKNLAGLIGAPCMISISLNPKGYPKIDNVTGAPNGMPVPELENDPIVFDWDEPNMEVFKRFPEFIQNKIKSSLNYQGSPLHRNLMMENSNGSEEKEQEY
jgi:hypothetical protein